MSNAVIDAKKAINREIANTKKAQSKELKSIERNHQDVVNDIKQGQAADIVAVQGNHQLQVLAAAEKKEKVLQELKTSQQQTVEMTDKELKNLKTQNKVTRELEMAKLSAERERLIGENNSHLEELNSVFNEKTRETHEVGSRELEKMNLLKKEEFSTVKGQHIQKINDQTQNFNTRFKFDENNYRDIKTQQDSQFKRERAQTNINQQKNMTKMTSDHTNLVEQKEKVFKKDLKAQELVEEQKYHQTMKVHQDNFKNLDDLHKKVVAKVKTDMTEKVSTLVNRSDDPFYKFTELKPILSTFPDRVEIRVDVPEHSKQDLQIALNQKEVVLNFNRRYNDSNKNALGSSKISKIESFTSRVMTDAFLDQKSIKSTYDNGTMTYVIKKA